MSEEILKYLEEASKEMDKIHSCLLDAHDESLKSDDPIATEVFERFNELDRSIEELKDKYAPKYNSIEELFAEANKAANNV